MLGVELNCLNILAATDWPADWPVDWPVDWPADGVENLPPWLNIELLPVPSRIR